MNSQATPCQRARAALELLAAARPTLPPAPSHESSFTPELAKELAAHSGDLSLALAGMVRSGDATAYAARIDLSLAALHDAISRIHRLPTRPRKI